MRKLVLLFSILLGIQSVQAQDFKKRYSHQRIPLNGYYFKGKLLVSPTTDNGIIYTGSDNLRNLNVTKLTNTGCVEWSYSYDFGSHSVGTMVKQLNDGGYLVGGNLDQIQGNDNDLLLKITSTGNLVWSRLLNTTEFVTDCAQSGSTVAIVTGQTGQTSESSFLQVNETTGAIISISKLTRAPVDGSDTSINCHFNRIIAVPFGGYYLAGNVDYPGPTYRKPLLVYVDSMGMIQSFKVFSVGASIDEIILQPSNTFLIAIENYDYSYTPAYPNSYARMTLMKINTFGSIYWQKFYIPPTAANNVAQHYPNSIVGTSSGGFLISGVADQQDGSLNYLFKIDNSGNILGDMHKLTLGVNSGITSLSKTMSNDFIATLNGRGMMRFTDNLDNLCDATTVPYISVDDTMTQIESETGVIYSITDATVVANPIKYAAIENVTTTCGTECPKLKCYGNNSSTTNLNTGLLAYYPFGGGSLNDYSGNGHHLTNTTTAHMAADRNGNNNCAFEFDNMPYSKDEFLSTTDTAFLNGLGDYSISLWYKPTETSGQPSRDIGTYETLIGRDYIATVATPYMIGAVCPDRTGQWTVGLYDCRYAVFGGYNSVWQTYNNDCNITPNTGQWHHLTAVYNQSGPTMKLYRDGVLQGNPAGTVEVGAINMTDCFTAVPIQEIGDLFLGKNYTGLIDDVFIHNRELSPAEVNQLYTLGSSCCSGGQIVANDDAYNGIDGSTGGSTASVLANDTLNANLVTPSQVSVTMVSATNPNLTVDTGGIISIASGTASGTYTLTYQICEWADLSNCDTATATIVVTVPLACWDRFSLGGAHTLAIKTDGTLWAWGQNFYGQLGIGNNTNTNTPVQIGTDNDWKAIFGGTYLSHAIKNDGTLWAWGDNSFGQFGDGTLTSTNVPVQVGTATDWKYISVGRDYTFALKNNNTLWATGDNFYGQLGDGTNIAKTSFIQIGTDNDWQSCRAGTNQISMARKTNGTLFTWGSNNNGQLGDGTNIHRNVPALFDNGIWQPSYASGLGFGLAMRSGQIYSWGYNTFGSLGDGTNTDRLTPQPLNNDTDWNYVDSGYYYGIAKKNNGTLWMWGYNTFGGLGNGTFTDTNAPGLVNNDTDWDVIYSTMHHVIAKKTDGTFWEWGWNQAGQLGDGTNINMNVPTQLSCSPLSNQAFTDENSFSVFPNPTRHDITISARNKISKVEVYDVNGRIILKITANSDTMTLDIEKLSKGIYMLKVTTDQGNSTQKIIKE